MGSHKMKGFYCGVFGEEPGFTQPQGNITDTPQLFPIQKYRKKQDQGCITDTPLPCGFFEVYFKL